MNQKEINQAEWSNRENWSFGFNFSKKDTRIWVPKQVPWMGWTLNIGTRGGAVWLLGFIIGLPLFCMAVVLIPVVLSTQGHS